MSSFQNTKLRNPPIVEAVFDVDCDLPPGFDLASLEVPIRARFADQYPKFQTQFLQTFAINAGTDSAPNMSTHRTVQAFQCRHEDEKQLVQLRAQGFSFNRLAPYTSLDDYLPEIERTWRLYVELASPIHIRIIRLRFINRIFLPMAAGKVDLDEFLKLGPRMPDEENLRLCSFLTQQVAIEKNTGHELNLVLTAEAPVDEKLPAILDITVASATITEPTDWPNMLQAIEKLRSLKNHAFFNTLTPECIDLFQS